MRLCAARGRLLDDTLDALIAIHVYRTAAPRILDPVDAEQAVGLLLTERREQSGIVSWIGENVPPGEQERAVGERISAEQKRTSGPILHFLSPVDDLDTEATSIAEMALDDLRMIAGDDDESADACVSQRYYDVLEERPAADPQHRLRQIFGQPLHPRTAPRGEHQRVADRGRVVSGHGRESCSTALHRSRAESHLS